jgi:serine/threonine protein phosphatase PrpC
MTVAVSAATDVGLRRQQNEDSHGTWTPDDPAERGRRGVLLVVADGMGGSLAGEVASRIAVQTVMRVYREAAGADALENLVHSLTQANAAVHDESATKPELTGMGTTCTAIVIRDRDLYVAHVGDSRAYLVRDGQIRQVSHDHSLVAQMVRDGQLTPDQAKSDPRRNVVTRSVGVGAYVEVDGERFEGALEPGDTLVLCSDGLHGQVHDDELAEFASEPDLDHGCRDAIALANERGGPDNITVIMARVAGAGGAPRARAPLSHADDPAIEPADETVMERVEPEFAHARVNGGARVAEVAEARASRSRLLLWLIVALTVLVLAVVAMAIVWQRIGREKQGLEGHRADDTRETQTAWRP